MDSYETALDAFRQCLRVIDELYVHAVNWNKRRMEQAIAKLILLFQQNEAKSWVANEPYFAKLVERSRLGD